MQFLFEFGLVYSQLDKFLFLFSKIQLKLVNQTVNVLRFGDRDESQIRIYLSKGYLIILTTN